MSDRPDFQNIKTADEFDEWYWLKTELVEICSNLELAKSGSKAELRSRIIQFLNGDAQIDSSPKKTKSSSKFNWAKELLSLETEITDNVSFGPNFRTFMTEQIGPKFVCHGDFMNWVKNNIGLSLADAVEAWQELERRKEDPDFRREIADHNVYNQYVRDFMDAFPNKSINLARKCWLIKRTKPAKEGKVKFEKKDLKLVQLS